MNFIISDTHFNHKNIIEYCKRPFASVEQMNQTMIANWNSVVGPKDRVFHLGDIGFGSVETLAAQVAQLNGENFLILGNHDTIKRAKRLGFTAIASHMTYLWQGRKVELSHYEPTAQHKGYDYWIHGHTHSPNRITVPGLIFNASVEAIGYTPQPIEKFLQDCLSV